jgi:hypothetical protein
LTLLPLAAPSVTWIKVQKPVFDLVGVVLSSFALAGVCVLAALALGAVLGLGFILRARRLPSSSSWVVLGAHPPDPPLATRE